MHDEVLQPRPPLVAGQLAPRQPQPPERDHQPEEGGDRK
jgi:hypothetical protein